MEKVKVYADLDCLSAPTLVGDLQFEMLRGTPNYHFQYERGWLQKHSTVSLSGDLQNFSGFQHKSKTIFGCFSDAMPDRWGRRLIEKRERQLAASENRPPRTLTDFDYLSLLDDFSRIGGFRFKTADGHDFLGTEQDFPVPPLAELAQFIQAAHAFERAEIEGGTINDTWLSNLFKQGSSLGGARPKANIIDDKKCLCIAKIPSIHDEYDIALWEHFAHCLAKSVGIKTAKTTLIKLDGTRFHTLLSQRFDRDGEKRIHFASSLALLGLPDGANADSGNGYLDIVDLVVGSSGMAKPEQALRELYRRVAFNIAIGNHDDHFRNHGFLLTKDGWTFSPAYDLNPTNSLTQSILISENSNESSLKYLLDASDHYLIEKAEAQRIINEVRRGVQSWRSVARLCQIPVQEQERFAARIENAIAE